MKNYDQAAKESVAVADDPNARELLRKAYESTYRWPAGFNGFSASLEVTVNGKSCQGTVKVVMPETAEVSLPDGDLSEWVQDQIEMLAVHRRPRQFDESDGRHTLTFGEKDAHPLGRLVIIHGDGLNTRYRVRENRIAQVNRNMGPVRFTINIQDSISAPGGKFLNTRYIVYYFTPKGDLKQAESFNDDPVSIEGLLLPGKRTLFLSEGNEVCVKQMIFSDHQIL